MNAYHNLVVLFPTTLVLYINVLLNSTIESIIYNSIKQTKMIVVQFGLVIRRLSIVLFSYESTFCRYISYLTLKSVLDTLWDEVWIQININARLLVTVFRVNIQYMSSVDNFYFNSINIYVCLKGSTMHKCCISESIVEFQMNEVD